MIAPLLIGASAGLAAGAVMTFLSHIAPQFGAGNFIRDMDRPVFFSRELSRREAHYIGILMHLAFALLAGLLFAFALDRHWVPAFAFLPIVGWSFILFLVIGLILLPLEGHGFFGSKHDAWFPVDLLLTCLGWGGLFYLFMQLWIPR